MSIKHHAAVCLTVMLILCLHMTDLHAQETNPQLAKPALLLNPMDFGATGDGVTDDTEAFNRMHQVMAKTDAPIHVHIGHWHLLLHVLGLTQGYPLYSPYGCMFGYHQSEAWQRTSINWLYLPVVAIFARSEQSIFKKSVTENI